MRIRLLAVPIGLALLTLGLAAGCMPQPTPIAVVPPTTPAVSRPTQTPLPPTATPRVHAPTPTRVPPTATRVSPTPTPTRPTATPARPTATPAPPTLQPASASTAPANTAASIPHITHPLAGMAECLQCHGKGGSKPLAANHKEYEVRLCLVCHRSEEGGALPGAVKHTTEGRSACLTCHDRDLLPTSHQAAELAQSECFICHAAGPMVTAQPADASKATATAPAGAVSFAKDVQPAFQTRCAMCHGTQSLGGLKLNAYAAVMTGGASGPSVVAGDPDKSPIVAKMKAAHPAVLDATELQKLVDWIKAGAKND